MAKNLLAMGLSGVGPPPLISGNRSTKKSKIFQLLFLQVSLEGELMTFGHNADGQLGHNNKKDILVPTPVEALSALHVVRASCSKGEKGTSPYN